MLEVGIIICLAIVLFLILHNFPRTNGEGTGVKMNERKLSGLWKKMHFGKKKNNTAAIQKAIDDAKETIVAPSETESAQIKFKEDDPEVAQFLFEAESALGKSDLREAEEKAIEAVSKNKKCGKAYEIIGTVAMQRGSFDEAKQSFKTAIKCDPEIGPAYFGLGQIDLKNENFTESIENLQRAVALDRSRADWYCELGKAYLEVRQFAKAAKALKRAASLDIDNKEYKELAAEAEEKQRAHAAAFRK